MLHLSKALTRLFSSRHLSTMSAPVNDVLLVGFGAVGIIYAMVLERSGKARVTAIARSNYDVVKREGVHIMSTKYGNISSWRPHRLYSNLADALDRPYNYVVVATKTIPELLPTSSLLAPLLAKSYTYPQPVYMLMQNGLGIEKDIYDVAVKQHGDQKPQILSCAVNIGTNMLSDNVVEHNELDRVELGLYKPGNYSSEYRTDEEKALLDDIGGLLRSGGSQVVLAPEIQRSRFRKNFWNICFSSVATLSGYPVRAIFQHPSVEKSVVPVLREIMLENLAVGRALGFDEKALPSSIVEETIQNTAAFHRRAESKHKASMLLDYENGRPMEIEVILGEVVRKAKELNVHIPRIELLYAILLIAQNQFLLKKEKL